MSEVKVDEVLRHPRPSAALLDTPRTPLRHAPATCGRNSRWEHNRDGLVLGGLRLLKALGEAWEAVAERLPCPARLLLRIAFSGIPWAGNGGTEWWRATVALRPAARGIPATCPSAEDSIPSWWAWRQVYTLQATLKSTCPQANADEDGFQGLSLPKSGADDLLKAEAETQVDRASLCSPPALPSASPVPRALPPYPLLFGDPWRSAGHERYRQHHAAHSGSVSAPPTLGDLWHHSCKARRWQLPAIARPDHPPPCTNTRPPSSVVQCTTAPLAHSPPRPPRRKEKLSTTTFAPRMAQWASGAAAPPATAPPPVFAAINAKNKEQVCSAGDAESVVES
ncbi:hypothetical protein T484DRAFT_3638553 [Baffinella frigidus]|nr:hypothetical protein T484DRAFT_3638553 [Cryptophyta sp. CCMP2293]